MSIQRIALSALCLSATVVISLAVTLVSAEEDPFSGWNAFLENEETAAAASRADEASDNAEPSPLPPMDEPAPADEVVPSFPEVETASKGMQFFSPGKPEPKTVAESRSNDKSSGRRMKLLPPAEKSSAVVQAAATENDTDEGSIVPVSGSDEFLEYIHDANVESSAAANPDDGASVPDVEFGDDDFEREKFESDPFFDNADAFDEANDAESPAEDLPASFTDEADDAEFETVESSGDESIESDMPERDSEFTPEPNVDTVSDSDAADGPQDDSSRPFDFQDPASSDKAQKMVESSVIPTVDARSLPKVHTGVQSPTVQLKWTRHGDMNVGQECDCSLEVVNTGKSLVRNVTVEAAVPDGLRVVRATPVPRPGTASWTVGDMAPGAAKTIDMVVVPDRRGDVNLNAFVRFTGYSTSVFTVQEPMLKLSLEGSETVKVGEQATYVVKVENSGTGMARDVVIQANLPKGLQHRNGEFLSIDVGTLNPGEQRQARLNMIAVAGGDYRLAVRAVADGGLKDQSAVAVAIAEPRLEINIAGPDRGAAGATADYQLTVTNVGNVPSSNVRAKYRIPAEYAFVKADRGGAHRTEDQTVDWFVGTLQPGKAATYQVTLEAKSPGKATHQAGVISELGKVVLARHTTSVNGRPRLHLDVSSGEPAAGVGEEAVIRIVVQNEGTVEAGKVGLSCELPPGLEFTAADGPTQHIAENGVVVFRSVSAIDADSQQTYLIKARCRKAGSHELRVRVASASLSEPVIGGSTVDVGE